LGRGMSAADRPGESQQTAEQEDKSRIICHFTKFMSSSGKTAATRRS
jgi:hypothetical protein